MGRRLGQHFLFDPAIVARIADAAGCTAGDVVLEIGPGPGTLTLALAERAGRVIAIEADRRLAAALADRTAGTTVSVITGDALEVPWPPVSRICGNIPYQITSPLIEKALRQPDRPPVVFLVQREVADRLAARPGSPGYGALTVGVQLVATVEKLFAVKAGAFRPPPKVHSALVRLTPRERPLVEDDAELAEVRRLIQTCFQRRRQQLQRILRETVNRQPSTVDSWLTAAGLEPRTRPEDIPPTGYVTLARALRTL